jgi:hypothetical protein
MSIPLEATFTKRTQKDYSLSFKSQVVEEIESVQLARLQHILNKVFNPDQL